MNKPLTDYIKSIHDYLDTLTLHEESCLLNIVLFIALILTALTILSIFFGNEIIKYFNFEKRFPKLAIFFKIRSTVQKYSLMWNIFLLILICLYGIFMNMLVFL